MTQISATQVKSLRDKTGISMGDCKKALVEAQGDEKLALEILHKQYAGQLETRADKEAANGRIGAFADEQCGALVELRCETDFVANSDDFKHAATAIAEIAAKTGTTDPNQLMETQGADGKSGRDVITAAYSRLKENITLARAATIKNGVACYVHHNGLVGTVLAADGRGGEAGKLICMHIAAQQTLEGMTREEVDPKKVEQTLGVMRDQAAGKPEQIVEKIVGGKMDKWFKERVLPEQDFLPDDSKTVAEVAKEAGITIQGYLKFVLGEKTDSP